MGFYPVNLAIEQNIQTQMLLKFADCARADCQHCCVCTGGFSGNGNTCFGKLGH